jgi:hypothetical protein
MKDGIYRASLRGDSTHIRGQAEAVASELLKGSLRVESGNRTLLETRKRVESGWRAVAAKLAEQSYLDLQSIERFVSEMPSPWTEREWMANALRQRLAGRQREHPHTK